MAVLLWFAFILLSLSYWKQLLMSSISGVISCDLLSFYYLCRTGNNPRRAERSGVAVVICFHFTIFVVLETTIGKSPRIHLPLWFAFILLSLSYWKQRWKRSKISLGVVICFHFTIFVVLETTRPWTAQWTDSCDLLSFYYLCRTGNNTVLVSVGLTQLWFAFILLSLSYWKQPRILLSEANVSCDLLSFYYLCRTGNNARKYMDFRKKVVICFHFTIFVVLETTLIS